MVRRARRAASDYDGNPAIGRNPSERPRATRLRLSTPADLHRSPDATLIRAGGLWSVGPHWLPCYVALFCDDALFALPRLAEIYDLVEEERNDLDHYLAIAAEFGARSVLDR